MSTVCVCSETGGNKCDKNNATRMHRGQVPPHPYLYLHPFRQTRLANTEKSGQDVDLHCPAVFTITLSSTGTSPEEICIFKGLWRHMLARVIVRATVSHTADPKPTAGASAVLRGLWEKPGCRRENATDVTLWARETRRHHITLLLSADVCAIVNPANRRTRQSASQRRVMRC